MNDNKQSKSRVTVVLFILLVVAAGVTYWYEFHRDVPQPAWISATARDNFLYGSTGAERTAGIPYWIWLALPRIFPEYLPYPGGYASLGLTWEEGREMPAGFSKKTVGYIRVAANCALCHAGSYRSGPEAVPEVVAAIPGHAVDLQALLTFLKQCAQDPRFNATELLAEIKMATELPVLDSLIYRFVLIPQTRQALLDQNSVLIDSTLRVHSQNPGAPFPIGGSRRSGTGSRTFGLRPIRSPSTRRWRPPASRCSPSTAPRVMPSTRPTRAKARRTPLPKSAPIAHCWTHGRPPRVRRAPAGRPTARVRK